MKSITISHLIMGLIIVSLLFFIVSDTHNSNDYIKNLLDDTKRELEACNYERLMYLNKIMYQQKNDEAGFISNDTIRILVNDSITIPK